MLVIAVLCVSTAFVLYTVGVWSPRKTQRLKPWHALCLWLGFILDTTGTSLMAVLAGGGFRFTVHGVTGAVANGLMLGLAVWATVLLVRRNRTGERNWGQTPYHKGSLLVWGLWLVPMVLGMVLGGRV